MATWAGYGLSAGVESYLRTRAESARENYMDQTARVRAAQATEAERSLANRAALPDDLASLYAYSPQEVQLAPGAPGTSGTVSTTEGATQEPAGNQATTPAVSQQSEQDPNANPTSGADVLRGGPAPAAAPPVTPQLGGTGAGGTAPDATLGNTAQITSVTSPIAGRSPIMGRYLTRGQIMSDNPALYARLMQTPEGQKALQDRGVVDDTTIAQRQKLEGGLQDAREISGQMEVAARQGDSVHYAGLEMARAERLAEVYRESNPALARDYLLAAEKSRATQGALVADEAGARNFGEQRAAVMKAKDAYDLTPNADTKMGLINSLAGVTSKYGRAWAGQVASTFMARSQMGEFWNALMHEVQTNGGDASTAAEAVAAKSPDLVAEAIPELVKTKSPLLKTVLPGLTQDGVDGLRGNEGILARDYADSQARLDPSRKRGTSAYSDTVISKFQELTAATGEGKKAPLQAIYDSAVREFDQASADLANASGPFANSSGPADRVQKEQALNAARDRMNRARKALDQAGPTGTGIKPGPSDKATRQVQKDAEARDKAAAADLDKQIKDVQTRLNPQNRPDVNYSIPQDEQQQLQGQLADLRRKRTALSAKIQEKASGGSSSQPSSPAVNPGQTFTVPKRIRDSKSGREGTLTPGAPLPSGVEIIG